MKTKCIYNKGKDLPISFLDKSSWFNLNSEFQLVIGKEYVVYGVLCGLKEFCYLICNENYKPGDFPRWYPAPLFEATDDKLSKYWKFYFDKNFFYGSLAFKEFEEDPYYYEKLIDGDKDAVDIFAKYKKAMDAEAYIEQETDAVINMLLKPLVKTDEENGWYDKSQQQILNLLRRLKSDITKGLPISESTEYLNLLETVETLGIDTGELYGLLVRISGYINSLKSMS